MSWFTALFRQVMTQSTPDENEMTKQAEIEAQTRAESDANALEIQYWEDVALGKIPAGTPPPDDFKYDTTEHMRTAANTFSIF
jgi:hypothetical protein